MTPDPAYVATAHDAITEHLRNMCWRPTSTLRCGCHPSGLCVQHEEIRAAEQYGADVGLDILTVRVVHDTCAMPVGPGGATCIRRGDHRGGCLPAPVRGPRSANDPIEGSAA